MTGLELVGGAQFIGKPVPPCPFNIGQPPPAISGHKLQGDISRCGFGKQMRPNKSQEYNSAIGIKGPSPLRLSPERKTRKSALNKQARNQRMNPGDSALVGHFDLNAKVCALWPSAPNRAFTVKQSCEPRNFCVCHKSGRWPGLDTGSVPVSRLSQSRSDERWFSRSDSNRVPALLRLGVSIHAASAEWSLA
jgi:hypothetical protein